MPFKMFPDTKLSLNWAFFRKLTVNPDEGGMLALTACSMEPSNLAVDSTSSPGKYKVVKESFTLTVRVAKSSWVMKSATTNSAESKRLLNHERTHYLLASCVAWELYLQIRAVEETSVARLQVRLNELRTAAAKRVQELSDQYDRETNHGKISTKQQAWDLRIEKWDQSQSL